VRLLWTQRTGRVESKTRLPMMSWISQSILPILLNGSNASYFPAGLRFWIISGDWVCPQPIASQGVKIQYESFNPAWFSPTCRLMQDPFIGKIRCNYRSRFIPEESDMVSGFCGSKPIPFIHPLSKILESDFEESDFSYLFRPAVAISCEGINPKPEKSEMGHTRWLFG